MGNLKDNQVAEPFLRPLVHATGMYIFLMTKKYHSYFSLLFSIRQIYIFHRNAMNPMMFINSLMRNHEDKVIVQYFMFTHLQNTFKCVFHKIVLNYYINVLPRNPLSKYIKQDILSQ